MSEAKMEACPDLRFSVKEFKEILSLVKSLPAGYFYVLAKDGKLFYIGMDVGHYSLLRLEFHGDVGVELSEPSGYIEPSEALKVLRKLKDGLLTYRVRQGRGGSLLYNGLAYYTEQDRDDVGGNTFVPQYSDFIVFRTGLGRFVEALSPITGDTIVIRGGERGVYVESFDGDSRPLPLQEAPTDVFIGYYAKELLHGPLSHVAKLSKHAVLDVKITERCVVIFECEVRFGKITYYTAPCLVDKPKIFRGVEVMD